MKLKRAIVLVGSVLGVGLLSSTVAATTLLQSRASMSALTGTAGTRMATTTKTIDAYWWNDGSCHGYPDVMQLYEVFRDENGNVTDYRDAGLTSGTDSCNQYL